MDIPTLTTARLTLRPPAFSDYPAYAAFLASPRSAYMGGPFTGWAAWGMFCHDVACWQLFGHGALMMDLRESGQCIGEVGINHGPQFPEKELGWLLFDGHEGQGYATEAATAMRDWAFTTLRLPTLVSYCDETTPRPSPSPSAWAPAATISPPSRILKTWSTAIGDGTSRCSAAMARPCQPCSRPKKSLAPTR